MTDAEFVELVVSTDGTTRSIYDERFDMKLMGRIEIVRASHVEPTPSGDWLADLAPVDGPQLGPFENRSEALAAEVAWLQQNWLIRSNE
ncbi:hypothetical protein [Rhodopirellula europaea]|uniref:hypothetical protein n=1 Tax=Rhodopirellula europaea TaxID=1263866 RepID=UPI003D2B8FB9|tara:strand:+ start:7481 stop:7747 length:267 start_codon:yes stop_codon:yes gene_type:complete